MRASALAPPAVHYPLRADAALAWALMAGCAALAGCLLLWRWAQDFEAWRYQMVWLAACGGWLLLAWQLRRWYRRLPQGWLVWTGLCWRLDQATSSGARTGRDAASKAATPALACHLALDLRNAMLLRLQAAPASHAQGAGAGWAWVARKQAPQHWHALRCAVYGTASAPAPAGANAA